MENQPSSPTPCCRELTPTGFPGILGPLIIGFTLTFGCIASSAPAAPPTSLPSGVPSDASPCRFETLVRKEHRIASRESGVELFVMSMAAPGPKKGAVVFTHGAGSASSALWDLPGDYSVMRRFACEGFDTYTVDVRGFGGSSLPPHSKNTTPPPVRAADVMPDVEAVVAFARAHSKVTKVDLVGWSWGCVVSGMYTSRHPEEIRRLVLFAPVWNRKWPSRHAQKNEWKHQNRDLFFKYFDPKREERTVLEAHVEALFRFSGSDGLRLSNGPYFDLYGKAPPVWDPTLVKTPTLVVRGEKDRASLETHAYQLFQALASEDKHYVVLGHAGHFAFRTKRYRALQNVMRDFLTSTH